jgi:hypothetical protein
MKKPGILAAALTLGVCSASAVGAADGMYLGAALQPHFDSGHGDHGFKLIGGFRIAPHVAFETAYTDFDTANAPSVKSWPAFVVGLWPATRVVDIYGKTGAARIKAASTDTRLAYGAGLQLKLGSVGLRAEYERFATNVVSHLDSISIGMTYTFGFGPR